MFSNYNNKAGIIAVLLISASTFVTCGVVPKKKYSGEISAIRLKEVMQLVNLENMQVVDFGKSFDIIYYDDLVAYHIADTMYAAKENSSTDAVPDTLTYPYLVYKKGQSHGLLYKYLHSPDYQKIWVDSMLNKLLSVRDEVFRTDSLFYLVDSIRDEGGGLLEKYVPKIKRDESYPDSGYLYFKKDLLDVEFSLSRQLDRTKGMKLLRGRFIYLPTIDSASRKTIPQREISFQISRQSLQNKENVEKFLERAKKIL